MLGISTFVLQNDTQYDNMTPNTHSNAREVYMPPYIGSTCIRPFLTYLKIYCLLDGYTLTRKE